MAAVPTCGLGCKLVKTHNFLKEKKKQFLTLSVFIVLLFEVVSLFLRKEPNYSCYWYPLLTQICSFLLLFSLFLWKEKLRFCFRKNLSILLLSIYYFFGSIAILFKFSNLYYYEIASFLILGASILTIVLSVFKKI